MTLLSSKNILPAGFRATGVASGIKQSGGKDLALFVSDSPCVAAAMLTSNDFKAAPLLVSAAHLGSASIRAIIANSGNANCMTGRNGLQAAQLTTELVAKALGVKAQEVLVASTGIIGKPLPVEKIQAGIPGLIAQLSPQGLNDASRAIMTTDTCPKVVVVSAKVGGKTITISGTAKGAGMIAPRMKMGTMFAFCFTDAAIEKSALRQALVEAVEPSFNSITIDGCMSTNDMAVVLANARASNPVIKKGSSQAKLFGNMLKDVCLALAKMMVKDGEGATKFVEVRVCGAKNDEAARAYAFSVANSNLFKCAMFGCDANWGRIASAVGSAGSGLKARDLSIRLNGVTALKSGQPMIGKKKGLLKAKEILVEISIGRGQGRSVVYTSDLSYDYVKINADYN